MSKETGIKEKGVIIYAGVFLGWALGILTVAIYLRPELLVGNDTNPGVFPQLWGIILGMIGSAGAFWGLRQANGKRQTTIGKTSPE